MTKSRFVWDALKEDTFGAVLYMDDCFFMKRVLRLAERGTGRVSPNPRVGALVVKEGKILSEGYHTFFGGPHAEINALDELTFEESRGGTLFVNLEPCSHFGKTPPCTDTIIQSGIECVVVGTADPNPAVKGKGIQKLKEAGIAVKIGVLEKECSRLNETYFKFITKKKPFITLKVAQTLDGKIATSRGHSRWITSEASRRWVHQMRKESDAVLVGVNTILTDDPQLTVRLVRGGIARRFILDEELRIPLKAQVLRHPDPQNTIVVTTPKASSAKVRDLQECDVTVWVIEDNQKGMVDLTRLWKRMAEEGISSVLVEGGKTVFTSVLRTGEVDRVVVFIAPKFFGKGIEVFGDLGIDSPSDAMTFRETAWRRRGQDMVFEGRL